MLFSFFSCFVLFWDWLSPCSPGCPGIHHVDQTGFKLTESHLPPSWVLELKHMPGLCMVSLCLKSYSHVLIAWLHVLIRLSWLWQNIRQKTKGRKFSLGSVFQRFWHFLQGKVWWNWAAMEAREQRDAWSHWGPHGQGSAAYVESQSIPLWKLRGKLLIAVFSNPVKLVIKVTDSYYSPSNPPPSCQTCTTSTLPT